MTWQYTPYIWFLLASALMTVVLAVITLRRWSVPESRPIFGFLVAAAIWSLTYAIELSLVELPAKLLLIKFEYIGIVFVPVFWLGFVLRYTGRDQWITTRRVLLMIAIPIMTLLLVWTDQSHHLIYAQNWVSIDLGPSLLQVVHGLGFWIYTAYAYAVLFGATLLLVLNALVGERSGVFRGQAAAVTLGALVPWVGNALYVFEVVPIIDLTPFAFSLTGLLIVTGVIRFRLFDLVPAAYQQAIHNMSVGVIILDRQNRVVGLNPAAEGITGLSYEEAIAQPGERLFPDLAQLLSLPEQEKMSAEVQFGAEPDRKEYELHLSSLLDASGRLTGRLVLLRDLSWRKSAERALRQERDRAQRYLDIAEVILLVIKPDGEVTLLNRKGCRVLGYEPHEVIGRNWLDLCVPDEQRASTRAVFHEIVSGNAELYEYNVNSIVTRAGEEFLIAWHNTALTDAEGRVNGILSSGEDITERVKAEDELRRRSAALAALHETAVDLAAQRAIPDLLSAITGRAVALLQARDGIFWGYRPGQDDLEFVFSHTKQFNFPGETIKRGESLVGRVLESGRPLVVDDIAEWPGRATRFGHVGHVSCVAVPISRGAQPLGVLELIDDIPRKFSRTDVELLLRFVPLASAALEQIRLFEEAQSRYQEAETLRQAMAALAGTLSLAEVLEEILEQLERVVPYHRASLFLLDGDHLQVVGARGFDHSDTSGHVTPAVEELFFQTIYKTHQPLYVADLRTDPRFVDFDISSQPDTTQTSSEHRRGRVQSWLGVPLILRGDVIGCLALDNQECGAYDEDEARLAQAFANQAAVVIQNVQLYEESQKQLQAVRALLEVSRDVASTLELDEVLHRVLRAAIDSISSAETGALHLYDAGRNLLVVRAGVGVSSAAMEAANFRPGEGYAGWVFSHGEPLILGDVFQDPRTKPLDGYWSDHGISALCVPLVVRGKIIGTLSLDNLSRRDAFDSSHLEVLQVFAGQVAVAIENARLHSETERQLQDQIILREAGAAISAALDMETVLSRVAEHLCRAADATGAYICDLDEETMLATVLADYLSPSASDKERVSDLGSTYKRDDPELWREMQSGRHLVKHRNSPTLSATDHAHMIKFGAQSILFIPLRTRGRLIGFAEIWESRHQRKFDARQVALCQQIAQQAAAAMENARLYDDTLRNARRLSSLNQISQDMTALLDMSALLKLVAAQATWLTEADKALIVVIDVEAEALVEVVGFGYPPNSLPRYSYQEFIDGLGGWVVEHRTMTVSADVALDPRTTGLALEAAQAKGAKSRAVAVAPMMIQDRIIGTLTVVKEHPHQGFDLADQELVVTLAGQAAVSIENARLYRDANQSARQMAMLYEVAAAASQSVRLQDVLEHTVTALDQAFEPDNIAIFLVEPDSNEIAAQVWAGFSDEGPIAGRRPIGMGVPGWVVEHGEPLLLPDVRQDPRYFCGDPDTLSELCVPLLVGQRVTGALNLERHELNAFDQEDLRILSILAGHLAAVVENARLVENLEADVVARTAEVEVEQEKSAVILREVGDAIAMFDLGRRIQYVNPAFVSLSGFREDEALGQDLFTLLGDDVVGEQDRPALDAALASGEDWQGEVTVRRKDGRLYDAHLTLAAIHNAAGRLQGYVSSHEDISRLKDLDRARSRFLTSISHELRTPATTLKLYANLLRQGIRPEKAEDYLLTIEAQANRLGDLIQDVLEMTVLDGGQAVSSWQPVQVSSLINDLLTRFESMALRAEIDLSALPAPADLPAVNGDQARLMQAMGEMVENALTYTPAGEQVTLAVEKQQSKGRSWLVLKVQDTGPGITADEQEKVFDRFFRGQLADPGHIPGTGLGLSMVQTIAKAHGGRVQVRSQEGQGSEFLLWLPAVDA